MRSLDSQTQQQSSRRLLTQHTMAYVHGPALRLLRRPALRPTRALIAAAATAVPMRRPVLQILHARLLASRRSATAASEEDLAAARKWLQKLDSETIPPNIGDVSFSRSSGPGGQNVNKYRSLGFPI